MILLGGSVRSVRREVMRLVMVDVHVGGAGATRDDGEVVNGSI
jgi:hypothetical protein